MKKRKIFKTLAFSSLAACMFCLPILAGCTPAEMSPQNPAQGQNFDLGLTPETDPIVYTTQSGLQIKKSDAKYNSTTTTTTNKGKTYTQDLRGFYYFTMGKFSGTIYSGENNSYSTTYQVTNEPVNWLIIGKGPGFNFENNTPAGSAIQGEANKQEIAFSGSMYQSLDLSAIPQHSDIPKGCFLVLSEKCIGQSYFNSSGTTWSTLYKSTPSVGYEILGAGGNYGNRYRYMGDVKSPASAGGQTWNNKTAGSLYTYINSLFSKNHSTGAIEGSNKLGLTQAEADMIVPQQLYTFYSNGYGYERQETPSSDGGTYYTMFPLAYRASHPSTYQNFCIEDYLKTNSTRITSMIGTSQSYPWWLRNSPNPNGATPTWNLIRNTNMSADGSVSASQNAYGMGVRPAMVMKLQ